MRTIDADDLKESFDVAVFNDEDDYKRALRIIDSAPTIPMPGFKEGYKQAIIDGKTNFSRQKGEWVLIKNSDGVLKCYECSECKKCQGYISNFCEDCGADMRGDVE